MTKSAQNKMSDGDNLRELSIPPCKRIRVSEENVNGGRESTLKLKEFTLEKVLCNNTKSKTVTVLGRFQDKSGVAIILFEKNAFHSKDLDNSGYFAEDSELRSLFDNDIYGNFICFPKPSLTGVKTTIIYPATEKHIAKYSYQQIHIINESPEFYRELTLPHITGDSFNLQWVYNILEGRSEQARIVHDNKCEREGFVLLPDIKWDGLSTDNLYLLAIVRRRNIKSLRDLDDTHLPLLKRVRDEGKKAIFEKYGVPSSQLRIYFHYQPSFYHLHIHFTYLRHEPAGIHAEKSHLLDTVINNLTMMPQYYKQATIPFTIREMDNLFDVYEINGHIQRIKTNVQKLIDK